MATLQNHSKLDEEIKNSLSKYESSNQSSDWSRMENMLKATPKATKSNWTGVVSFVIGIAVLSLAYLIYDKYNTTKPAEQLSSPANQVKAETNGNAVISEPVIPKAENENSASDKSTIESSAKNDNSISNTENKSEVKTNKTAEAKTIEAVKENNSSVKPKIYIMGNTPVFGDMLDSSKGIIGETKEKESTKKAAINHSDKPIGWNKFINSDSLNKFKEEHLKDSLNANSPKK